MVQDFHDGVQAFLVELCGMKEAFAGISQRYFAGQEVLFPDLAECLSEMVEDTEALAQKFDVRCKEGEGHEAVDRDKVRHGAGAVATGMRSYLVDMAKADALEFMGEKRAGLELVERHLE